MEWGDIVVLCLLGYGLFIIIAIGSYMPEQYTELVYEEVIEVEEIIGATELKQSPGVVIGSMVEYTFSDVELIEIYLDGHPVPEFKNTSERVLAFSVDEDNVGHLNYSTSTANPVVESFYWVGVVYKVFPEVSATWIEGYNWENKLIVASKRYHPNSSDYFFSTYSWFNENYAEQANA